jgi:hypothetical protein
MVIVPELALTEPFVVSEAPERLRPPAEIVVPPVVWLPPERVSVPLPSLMMLLVVVSEESVVFVFAMSKVVAAPETTKGAVMETLPAAEATVSAVVVVPSIVRLPPEMPTGAVVLIVREEMVLSPPRLVEVSFEEPVAEKTM